MFTLGVQLEEIWSRGVYSVVVNDQEALGLVDGPWMTWWNFQCSCTQVSGDKHIRIGFRRLPQTC